MKKILATTVVALILGVATFQLADAGRGNCNGPNCQGQAACQGPGNCQDQANCQGPANCPNANGGAVDQAALDARQKFFEESAPLREKLFAKRGEYQELLRQENVDKDKANALWSEIFDLQTELRQLASDRGLPQAGFGPGPGSCNGSGPGAGCGQKGNCGQGGGPVAMLKNGGPGFMRQAVNSGKAL